MVIGRALTVAAVMAALVLGPVRPAAAGGAHWRFDHDAYQPGVVATGVTAIGWEHNPGLGTPADGPYFAYLVPAEQPGEGVAVSWPSIPPGAVKVAQVEINEGPVEEAPGFWVGPHHARLQFTVPALPAGRYEVLHCNVPCTKALADIIGGTMVIGTEQVDPAPAPTTQPTPSTSSPRVESSEPAPAALPLSTTGASASADTWWLPPTGVAVGAIGLVAILRWLRVTRRVGDDPRPARRGDAA